MNHMILKKSFPPKMGVCLSTEEYRKSTYNIFIDIDNKFDKRAAEMQYESIHMCIIRNQSCCWFVSTIRTEWFRKSWFNPASPVTCMYLQEWYEQESWLLFHDYLSSRQLPLWLTPPTLSTYWAKYIYKRKERIMPTLRSNRMLVMKFFDKFLQTT